MRDESYEKMLSNVEQIKTRGGQVIVVVSEGDVRVREKADYVIETHALPDDHPAATVGLLMWLCCGGAEVDQLPRCPASVVLTHEGCRRTFYVPPDEQSLMEVV